VDLVVGDFTSAQLLVFRGGSGGRFPEAPDQRLGGPSSTFNSRVALGDLDGDGLLDIVSAHNPFGGQPMSLALFFQRPDRMFSPVPDRTLSSPISSSTILLEDLDLDGRTDIVHGGLNRLRVLLQGDGGEFTAQEITLGNTSLTSVAIADLSGDGLPDLVAATALGMRVFFQAGQGSFSPVVDRVLGLDVSIFAAPFVTAA
jgi:hypothetical protein